MTESRHLFLLGPQPDFSGLCVALDRLDYRGPAALITAGWETEEQRDERLQQVIGREAVNLHLFARSEQLFAEDRELITRLRQRQDELRHLRDVYNDRLGHLLRAARQVLRRVDSLVDLEAERESAVEMIRQLDRQYFVRTSQIIDRYEDELQTTERPLVVEHRRQVADALRQAGVLIIAGGHVGIILNRLRIFGVFDVCPALPVIAWSGGAMALAEQVVFYHDFPPQGPGNPEVLRAGVGLFHDLLPLPDAQSRLSLEDQIRIQLFARRFERFNCVPLDDDTVLQRVQGRWASIGASPAQRLGSDGSVVELER